MPAVKTFIPITIFLIIFLGLDYIWNYRLSLLWSIVLYLLIYFLVSALASSSDHEDESEEAVEWPTSGPIGKYGQKGLIFTFTVSGFLCLLNPFLLLQIIRQGMGNFVLKARLKDNPDKYLNYQSKINYSLPFEDEWFVYNGGTAQANSHSWEVVTQRYAYDFVIADSDKVRHTSNGTALQDYFCYGKNICAAADGKVVKVVNGVKAAPFLGYGIVDFTGTNFVGNHVIIEHASNEYGLYAHLIKGNIPLAVGEQVKRGEVIGKCGHSGHSSEPHLHFHLQDTENFYSAMGLPVVFSELVVDGEVKKTASIQAGQFVSNHPV